MQIANDPKRPELSDRHLQSQIGNMLIRGETVTGSELCI